MVKTYKTILSVLLVVLLVCAVVTVTGVIDINKLIDERERETVAGEEIKHSYEDVFSSFTSAGLPLMKTDVENVFYTMNKAGEVSFYKVNDKNIEKIEDTKVFAVTVVCSGQKLPVTIYSTVVDGRTLGYGLFTNEKHPEVFLYDYAFFKVTDQFDAYSSKSELILLIDVEKDRFYDENKVYSESYYLYKDYTSKTFLNEDQRIVDLNARLRTDYKMFTDGILHQSQDKILFFSSRFYNDFEYSDSTDVFISGGYGENVDNNRYILDVASLDIFRTEKGVYYFKNNEISSEEPETEEPSTDIESTTESKSEEKGSFSVMFFDGKASNEIISFEGSLKEDFILSGTKLLNIKTGEIYDVLSGDTQKLDYKEFETTFIPDLFEVSENGSYCLVRGKNNLGKPSLGVMDFTDGKFYTYTDNVFGHIASMQALNDGTIVLSLAASEAGENYYQLVSEVGFDPTAQENVG